MAKLKDVETKTDKFVDKVKNSPGTFLLLVGFVLLVIVIVVVF